MAKAKKEEGNRVSINSSALNKALKEIGAAVSQTSVLPILFSVHCSTTKDSMTMTTSDMGITMVKKVECDCSGEFVFLMPYDEVYGYTGKISSQPIKIIVDGDIFIDDDGGRVTFGKSEPPEHFPVRKDVEEKYRATVDEKFLKAIQKAKHVVSTNELEVTFSNVLIDINEERSIVLSSDKLRMFRYRQKPSGGLCKALVTTHFVKAIAGMKEAELYGNDEWIVAKSGSLEVIDRTAVVTNYPDCSYFFDNYKHNSKFAASDLIMKLDEIMVFKNSFYQAELSFENKNSIGIKYDDNDTNKHYNKSFPAKNSVETDKLIFNARDLRGLLMLLDDDEIKAHFIDQTKGAHFDSDDTNLFIMPLAFQN